MKKNTHLLPKMLFVTLFSSSLFCAKTVPTLELLQEEDTLPILQEESFKKRNRLLQNEISSEKTDNEAESEEQKFINLSEQPLVAQHVTTLITILRNIETCPAKFRLATKNIADLLAHVAATLLPVQPLHVTTPCGIADGLQRKKDPVIISVLRSSEALRSVFLEYFKDSRVGFVGLQRDEETAEAKCYYVRLPSIAPDDHIIILDPMLATGGSAAATIRLLLEAGAEEENIIFVGVIAAPEGIHHLFQEFPSISIIVAKKDLGLNDRAFIEPGLGDYGDRYFGTELLAPCTK